MERERGVGRHVGKGTKDRGADLSENGSVYWAYIFLFFLEIAPSPNMCVCVCKCMHTQIWLCIVHMYPLDFCAYFHLVVRFSFFVKEGLEMEYLSLVNITAILHIDIFHSTGYSHRCMCMCIEVSELMPWSCLMKSYIYMISIDVFAQILSFIRKFSAICVHYVLASLSLRTWLHSWKFCLASCRFMHQASPRFSFSLAFLL